MNSSFGSKTPHVRPLKLFSLPTKVINSNAWSNSGLTSSQEYRSREHEILQTSPAKPRARAVMSCCPLHHDQP